MAFSITCILHFIFRILFGLSLIGLGIRNHTEYQRSAYIAEKSLARISPKLMIFKIYLNDFLKYHSFLLVPIGFGTIFGIKKTKIFALFYTFVQIMLIDNFYFYTDHKFLRNALIDTSILGSVLYLN